MRLRDALGPVSTDAQFEDLFPARGKPGPSPTVVTIVLLLRFMENRPDRWAAAAVAARIDWKDALGLELTRDRVRSFGVVGVPGPADRA